MYNQFSESFFFNKALLYLAKLFQAILITGGKLKDIIKLK